MTLFERKGFFCNFKNIITVRCLTNKQTVITILILTNFQCGLLTLLTILETETKRACYNVFMHTHIRQSNFFAFRSSPPLRNAGISRHSSIWCTLVSHPVNRCKLPWASVISSCYCHANLKKSFFVNCVNKIIHGVLLTCSTWL